METDGFLGQQKIAPACTSNGIADPEKVTQEDRLVRQIMGDLIGYMRWGRAHIAAQLSTFSAQFPEGKATVTFDNNKPTMGLPYPKLVAETDKEQIWRTGPGSMESRPKVEPPPPPRKNPMVDVATTYERLLENILHLHIMCYEMTGDYEGDIYTVVRDAKLRYGFVTIGYGSCSGCDMLEACSSDYDVWELACDIGKNIKWFDTPAMLKEWCGSHDWSGDFCDNTKARSKVLHFVRDELWPV